MENEREREELRLAEREAERAAKRAKAAQESEATKQLAMAQRGMTEEEKEVCETILSRVGWSTEEIKRNGSKPNVYEKYYPKAGDVYNYFFCFAV